MDKPMQGGNDVRPEMQNATSSLRRAGEGMANDIKKEGERYMQEAQEGWNDFKDEVKDKTKVMRKRFEQTSDDVDKYAHENPWHVVGIAAAVGAVVALLVGGCRRRD